MVDTIDVLIDAGRADNEGTKIFNALAHVNIKLKIVTKPHHFLKNRSAQYITVDSEIYDAVQMYLKAGGWAGLTLGQYLAKLGYDTKE